MLRATGVLLVFSGLAHGVFSSHSVDHPDSHLRSSVSVGAHSLTLGGNMAWGLSLEASACLSETDSVFAGLRFAYSPGFGSRAFVHLLPTLTVHFGNSNPEGNLFPYFAVSAGASFSEAPNFKVEPRFAILFRPGLEFGSRKHLRIGLDAAFGLLLGRFAFAPEASLVIPF